MPREIALTKGVVAIVDDDDYADLMQFKWTTDGIYASRRLTLSDGRKAKEYMHRRLLPDAAQVDHINRDGRDNRRANLRPATKAQNMRNRSGPRARSRSGYRGVRWKADHKKWAARIQIPAPSGNGRGKHLGYFDTAEEAARVWDEAARLTFGEFAGALNFPDEQPWTPEAGAV